MGLFFCPRAEDAQRGNNVNRLAVQVDEIPEIAATRPSGKTANLDKPGERGWLQFSADYPYSGELDIDETAVVISELLDEVGGAGELIPSVDAETGQDLTLYASKVTGKTARFQTPKGQSPEVELRLTEQKGVPGVDLRVRLTDILEPENCNCSGRTNLSTKLVLIDRENAPMSLVLDGAEWRCKRHRKRGVSQLTLR